MAGHNIDPFKHPLRNEREILAGALLKLGTRVLEGAGLQERAVLRRAVQSAERRLEKAEAQACPEYSVPTRLAAQQ